MTSYISFFKSKMFPCFCEKGPGLIDETAASTSYGLPPVLPAMICAPAQTIANDVGIGSSGSSGGGLDGSDDSNSSGASGGGWGGGKGGRLPGGLYLGSQTHCSDPAVFSLLNIGAVVNVTVEHANHFETSPPPEGCGAAGGSPPTYLRCSILDDLYE